MKHCLLPLRSFSLPLTPEWRFEAGKRIALVLKYSRNRYQLAVINDVLLLSPRNLALEAFPLVFCLFLDGVKIVHALDVCLQVVFEI